MTVASRRHTFFSILKHNSHLVGVYLYRKSVNDCSANNLMALKRQVNLALCNYYLAAHISSIVSFMCDGEISKKLALKQEEMYKKLMASKDKLETFESCLAYMIMTEMIPSTSMLGYSNEYIKMLLDKKRTALQDATIEYSYDGNTGISRVSIFRNGRVLISPKSNLK